MPVTLHPLFHHDERVKALPPDTLMCYLLSAHWSDNWGLRGFVPQEWICVAPSCRADSRHVTELVDAGLWIERFENGPGYRYVVSLDDDSLMRFTCGEPQPLSFEVRRFVFERDQDRCRRCQSGANLTIDHIWPRALGGSDRSWNLRVLCRSCNSVKGASLPAPGEEHLAVLL